MKNLLLIVFLLAMLVGCIPPPGSGVIYHNYGHGGGYGHGHGGHHGGHGGGHHR